MKNKTTNTQNDCYFMCKNLRMRIIRMSCSNMVEKDITITYGNYIFFETQLSFLNQNIHCAYNILQDYVL